MPRDTFHTLWDGLLSEGVVSITAPELAERAHASIESVHLAVHHAKRAGKIFTPVRGLYVLVPPEYRDWGVVPADWFIDDMMRHLRRRYYVGFLSAANMHGASHQAAQVFQVVTDRAVANREVHQLRLAFYTASDIETRPVEERTGPTGRLKIATPETCVLDLSERPEVGGGVNVLLEVLGELTLDPALLVTAAQTRAKATVRRCGWLLERTHPHLDLSGLLAVARPGEGVDTRLIARGPRRGEHDQRWSILINTDAEGGS
jgi:predicted transcriptional regulator of viral defense system